MRFNFPENNKNYHWTEHSKRKMLFYGLSADRVKRIIRNPKRVENGVAENTIAAMTTAGTSKKPTEIWTMYQLRSGKKVIISAWRYPGISPLGKEIPIPVDILDELRREGLELSST